MPERDIATVIDPEGSPTGLAHAPTASPRPRHDGRSVGELLREADHLARDLLLDLTADDAPGLLRGWARLVDSAAAAWVAITVTTRPAAQLAAHAVQPPPPDHADPMLRLHAVADGIATTLASARWPGVGPHAPALGAIATTFDRVADLITRRAGELPLHNPEVRADAAAARMRLMHTVYLSAHASTSALQQHGRQLHHDTRHHPRRLQLGNPGLPYAVGPTARWIQRLGVCESIAGLYVRSADGGFAAAVTGETRPPFDEPNRLQRHLARWDVQVHRTLAADPSPRNLVLASRTHAFIAATTLPLLETAARAGILAGPTDVARLQRAVATSGEAWNQLASRWADLAPAHTRADPDLAHAADQLRAAGRELTHTSTGRVTHEDILDSVDLRRVIESVRHAAVAAVDVAHLARDLANNPDLTGPARPLVRPRT